VIKYHFYFEIDNLIENYHLFDGSWQQFFEKTLLFHQGDAASSWITAYYLFPLFIFVNFFGGLWGSSLIFSGKTPP
jgi:hypothetical protein